MNLTVACVWVRGNVPYTAEYVTRLAGMVSRNLDQPYRFVCLTDQPWALPSGIGTIPINSPAPLCGWWAKMQLFNRAHGFHDRVLYLDLDTLVIDRLEPIADYPAPFALVPPGGTFQPKDGKKVITRFNSSVMAFDADRYRSLYDAWTPACAERLWGDQDYLGASLGAEAVTMPTEWFPRLSAVRETFMRASGGRVILAKKPKPEQAMKQWAWVKDIWRAA